jgi:hypothetical protein
MDPPIRLVATGSSPGEGGLVVMGVGQEEDEARHRVAVEPRDRSILGSRPSPGTQGGVQLSELKAFQPPLPTMVPGPVMPR